MRVLQTKTQKTKLKILPEMVRLIGLEPIQEIDEASLSDEDSALLELIARMKELTPTEVFTICMSP